MKKYDYDSLLIYIIGGALIGDFIYFSWNIGDIIGACLGIILWILFNKGK